MAIDIRNSSTDNLSVSLITDNGLTATITSRSTTDATVVNSNEASVSISYIERTSSVIQDNLSGNLI